MQVDRMDENSKSAMPNKEGKPIVTSEHPQRFFDRVTWNLFLDTHVGIPLATPTKSEHFFILFP